MFDHSKHDVDYVLLKRKEERANDNISTEKFTARKLTTAIGVRLGWVVHAGTVFAHQMDICVSDVASITCKSEKFYTQNEPCNSLISGNALASIGRYILRRPSSNGRSQVFEFTGNVQVVAKNFMVLAKPHWLSAGH